MTKMTIKQVDKWKGRITLGRSAPRIAVVNYRTTFEYQLIPKREEIKEVISDFRASGLDPQKAFFSVFYQNNLFSAEVFPDLIAKTNKRLLSMGKKASLFRYEHGFSRIAETNADMVAWVAEALDEVVGGSEFSAKLLSRQMGGTQLSFLQHLVHRSLFHKKDNEVASLIAILTHVREKSVSPNAFYTQMEQQGVWQLLVKKYKKNRSGADAQALYTLLNADDNAQRRQARLRENGSELAIAAISHFHAEGVMAYLYNPEDQAVFTELLDSQKLMKSVYDCKISGFSPTTLLTRMGLEASPESLGKLARASEPCYEDAIRRHGSTAEGADQSAATAYMLLYRQQYNLLGWKGWLKKECKILAKMSNKSACNTSNGALRFDSKLLYLTRVLSAIVNAIHGLARRAKNRREFDGLVADFRETGGERGLDEEFRKGVFRGPDLNAQENIQFVLRNMPDNFYADVKEEQLATKREKITPLFNKISVYFNNLTRHVRFRGPLGKHNKSRALARLDSALRLLQNLKDRDGPVRGFTHNEELGNFSGRSHRWQDLLQSIAPALRRSTLSANDLSEDIDNLMRQIKEQRATLVQPFINETQNYFAQLIQLRRFQGPLGGRNWEKAGDRLASCESFLGYLIAKQNGEDVAEPKVPVQLFNGVSRRWQARLQEFQKHDEAGHFTQESRGSLLSLQSFIAGRRKEHEDLAPAGAEKVLVAEEVLMGKCVHN